MKRAAYITLGCKANQYDSAVLRQILEGVGYVTVPPEAQPDLVLVNSCAVTAEADRKTRQTVRQQRLLNPEAVIVLTGCSVQVGAAAPAVLPEADFFLGHKDALHLPALLEKADFPRVCVSPHPAHESYAQFGSEKYLTGRTDRSRTRANIKIEDGCNRFCSYCMIPAARGRVRSKALETLRKELAVCDAEGVAEVVLVGINLSMYGTDFRESADLADAAALAASFAHIHRVRLGSLEPEKLTPLLLKKLAAVTKLCPHFHVSLQSGSDKILRAMRRGYTAADFSAIIEHIRAYFPNAGVTTDVMVGFPGETEADFCATQELCRRISFSDMHIFPFSPRKGTPAADMPTQIEKQCKQERARQMRTLAAELRRRFWESQRGKTLMVLPETLAPGGGMAGFSENYIKITARHLTESDANHPTPVTIHAVTAAGCESLRP